MNEHFTLELFQAINDWQAYAIGKKINGEYISLKKKLGDKLNILTKNLPKKFKTYGGECYRKFNSSDNYKLGLGEFIKEEYSAWTIDFNIAQDDNFLRNANQQQRGIIFKKSICNEGDIILNLNELYQDKDFCTAIDLYKDR